MGWKTRRSSRQTKLGWAQRPKSRPRRKIAVAYPRRRHPYPSINEVGHARVRVQRRLEETIIARDNRLSKAVYEAIAERCGAIPTVFVHRRGLFADAGTPFKVLVGLVEEFGTDRVNRHAIAEPGFIWASPWARPWTAAADRRPGMFGDFLYLVNGSALQSGQPRRTYMSGGQLSVSVVLRTQSGRRREDRRPASAIPAALVAHIPGLKVANGPHRLLRPQGADERLRSGTTIRSSSSKTS